MIKFKKFCEERQIDEAESSPKNINDDIINTLGFSKGKKSGVLVLNSSDTPEKVFASVKAMYPGYDITLHSPNSVTQKMGPAHYRSATSSVNWTMFIDAGDNIKGKNIIGFTIVVSGSSAKIPASDYEMGIAVAYNVREITGKITEIPDEGTLTQAISNASINSIDAERFMKTFDQLYSVGVKVLKSKKIGLGHGPMQFYGSVSPQHIKNWGVKMIGEPMAHVSFDGTDVPKTDILGDVNNQISLKIKSSDGKSGRLISGTLNADAAGVLYAAFLYYNDKGINKKNNSSDLALSFLDSLKATVDSNKAKAKMETNATQLKLILFDEYKKFRNSQLKKWLSNQKQNKTWKKSYDTQLRFELYKVASIRKGLKKPAKKQPIADIPEISAKEVERWYLEIYYPNVGKHVKDSIDSFFELKETESQLKVGLDKLLKDSEFKKWAVYEAATGAYKFSGKLNMKDALKSPHADSIANKILVVDIKTGIEYYEDLDIAWAERHVGKVKFKFALKSSGSWTNLTLQASESRETSLGNVCDLIITEELEKLDEELLLEFSFQDAIDKGKKMLKSSFDKITDVVKVIWDRIWQVLTKWAMKGYTYMADKMGYTVVGTADVNIQF